MHKRHCPRCASSSSDSDGGNCGLTIREQICLELRDLQVIVIYFVCCLFEILFIFFVFLFEFV